MSTHTPDVPAESQMVVPPHRIVNLPGRIAVMFPGDPALFVSCLKEIL